MRTVPLNLTFFYFTIMIICKRASIWLANIWWTPMVGKKSNTNNSFINNPFGSHLVNESAGSVNKWTWIIGFDSFTNLNLKWLNYFIFSKHYYKMALDILEENEKSWKSSTFTILYDTSAFRHEASHPVHCNLFKNKRLHLFFKNIVNVHCRECTFDMTFIMFLFLFFLSALFL